MCIMLSLHPLAFFFWTAQKCGPSREASGKALGSDTHEVKWRASSTVQFMVRAATEVPYILYSNA